jgi:hypothetical protein
MKNKGTPIDSVRRNVGMETHGVRWAVSATVDASAGVSAGRVSWGANG